jgi:hypothetical protein
MIHAPDKNYTMNFGLWWRAHYFSPLSVINKRTPSYTLTEWYYFAKSIAL